MKRVEEDALTDIATNLSKLINHNVNIFNNEGIIVGSSDTCRVGKYHSHAYSVISGETKDYKVYDLNDESVKPGVNLPVLSDGNIIGGIGITGDPEEVIIFSEILRDSFESLIERKLLKDRQSAQKSYEKQIVLDLLFDLSSDKDIESRLKAIDFKRQKHNVLVKFYQCRINCKEIFSEVNCLEAKMDDKLVYVLSSNSKRSLDNAIEEIKQKDMSAIVSDIVDFEFLKEEYKILNFIEQYTRGKEGFYYTKDYKLSSFLYSLDYSKYDFYEAEGIIRNDSLVETFLAYVDNNLSLVHTSEKLFIHLNTLKYRIKRIEELTGCSLHNVDDILKLKLSILSLKSKLKHKDEYYI